MIFPDKTAKMALIALSYRSSSLGNVPLLCRLNLDQITFDMILSSRTTGPFIELTMTPH